MEAVKTNIFGTMNVLAVAGRSGVQRFVNISTDKAANPISVLGYTKRIAERLTAAVALEQPGTFLVGPLRQRARQPRVDARGFRGADCDWWPANGDAS